MTGTLWLPSVGTGAEFVTGPGKITARYWMSRDTDGGDAEQALTAVAKAIHGVAGRACPTIPVTEGGGTLCEAECFDDWGSGRSLIEVRLYARRAA